MLTKPASSDSTHQPNYLIAGLGNPGREYLGNRHNVGFMALDRLANSLQVSFSRLESRALVTKADYQESRLILAKPQTYMNLSGQAVGALLRFYKVPLEQLLIIYDDVDLPFGALRMRPGGGSAGQKGMASIIERIGSQDLPRLRIGVGRPPGRMDAAAYVLQDFSRQESEELVHILDKAVEAILTFVKDGITEAMNKFNSQSNGA